MYVGGLRGIMENVKEREDNRIKQLDIEKGGWRVSGALHSTRPAARHATHTRDFIYPAAPKRPGPQLLFTQSLGNHQVLRGSGQQQKQIPQIKTNHGGRKGRSAKVLVKR